MDSIPVQTLCQAVSFLTSTLLPQLSQVILDILWNLKTPQLYPKIRINISSTIWTQHFQTNQESLDSLLHLTKLLLDYRETLPCDQGIITPSCTVLCVSLPGNALRQNNLQSIINLLQPDLNYHITNIIRCLGYKHPQFPWITNYGQNVSKVLILGVLRHITKIWTKSIEV